MNDKVHRVAVSLTDTMHKLSDSMRERLQDSEVKLLDQTTLLLRMKRMNEGQKPRYYQQFQFDAVGYEDERHVRTEMNELLVQVFQYQRPGCLLRLTPRRAHNVKMMTRLLVSDVDKILLKLPYRLDGINVEYIDVRKFDMVNMLTVSHRNHRGKEPKSRREMQTTREMFQWLHNEYSILRGRGSGDDYINVEFVLRDKQMQQHKLHLAIFSVFDCNVRQDIANFFEALPTGRPCKSTLLTDCIKESFDSKRPIYTLILCEMPLDKGCAREMHRFLLLAHLAYSSKANQSMDDAMSSMSEYSSNPLNSSSTQSFPMSKRSTGRSLESLSLHGRPLNLSHEDYSKLASWYHRIDGKFSEVKNSMERHYDVQYRQKFLKICNQLQTYRLLSDKSGGDAQRMMLQDSAKDLRITANYVAMLKQFRQLEKEVQKSCFVGTLSTYMDTKNYELVNAEKALQEREIANLREQRNRIRNGFY